MTATPDKLLAVTAQGQAGVFTRGDALRAGFTPRQIGVPLARGSWVAIHPDVYCGGTTKRNREARAVAARLYAGADAVFSHFTAARLQAVDVPVLPRAVWVTVPCTRQLSRRPGVETFRTRHMPQPSPVAHGQPVTAVPRTVVDLAQWLDRDQLAGVLYDVVRRGLVDVEHIMAVADGLRGRAGLGVLRQVLQEFDPESESMIEAEGAALLSAAGFELVSQFEVYDGWLLIARIDLADPDLMLAIEIDGLRHHGTFQAQTRDRQRDRALIARGWTVVRFTANDVRRTPKQMVQEAERARDVACRNNRLPPAA